MKRKWAEYTIEQLISIQAELWAYSSDDEYEKKLSTRIDCLALIKYGDGQTDIVYMVSGFDGVFCAETLHNFLRVGYNRMLDQEAINIMEERRRLVIAAREKKQASREKRQTKKSIINSEPPPRT